MMQKSLKVGGHQVLASGSVIVFPNQSVDITLGDDSDELIIRMSWRDNSESDSGIHGAITGENLVELTWTNSSKNSLGATFLDPIPIGKYAGKTLSLLGSFVPVSRDPYIRLFCYMVRFEGSENE